MKTSSVRNLIDRQLSEGASSLGVRPKAEFLAVCQPVCARNWHSGTTPAKPLFAGTAYVSLTLTLVWGIRMWMGYQNGLHPHVGRLRFSDWSGGHDFISHIACQKSVRKTTQTYPLLPPIFLVRQPLDVDVFFGTAFFRFVA